MIEMNDPPTAVGGILKVCVCEDQVEISDPLTAVSGFCARPWLAQEVGNPTHGSGWIC